MTTLDETGLEAAYAALAPDLHKGYSRGECARMAEATITAYLAAVRTSNALRDLQRLGQECEGDRLAVVANAAGEGMGCTITATTVVDWQVLEEEARGFSSGPFRRQIVTIPGGLLRPEPVGEVSGTTEPA